MIPGLSVRQAAIHLGLFAACCATTCWAGGPAFAAALMSILLCHELGHYVVARRRGVDVSLPYFLPMPPGLTFGTLGAVIRMRSAISDRNALFDVGAAGPIAGLIVAVPLLAIGLSRSTVAPIPPDSMLEGNSLLYAALKYAAFGRWLPADGVDVQLHPMAFAGWVGLLITMINLFPIGQLDGGHVARAVFGEAHETLSRWLHIGLVAIGLVIAIILFLLAHRVGKTVSESLNYASYALPWLVWTVLLWWMRRRAGAYHPPVDDDPLDPRRRRAAIALLVIFALIATPVPFRSPL